MCASLSFYWQIFPVSPYQPCHGTQKRVGITWNGFYLVCIIFKIDSKSAGILKFYPVTEYSYNRIHRAKVVVNPLTGKF